MGRGEETEVGVVGVRWGDGGIIGEKRSEDKGEEKVGRKSGTGVELKREDCDGGDKTEAE